MLRLSLFTEGGCVDCWEYSWDYKLFQFFCFCNEEFFFGLKAEIRRGHLSIVEARKQYFVITILCYNNTLLYDREVFARDILSLAFPISRFLHAGQFLTIFLIERNKCCRVNWCVTCHLRTFLTKFWCYNILQIVPCDLSVTMEDCTDSITAEIYPAWFCYMENLLI